MTWPFGGLPLGGVFLGQAGGPLVQLARTRRAAPPHGRRLRGRRGGGHARGLAVDASPARARPGAGGFGRRGHRAGRGRRRPAPWRPTAARRCAPLRVALVQGGGQRGVSKEQVAPTAVYEAQLAATYRSRRRAGPGLVLWPEDVVALNGPLAGSPEAALLSRLAAELHTTLAGGRDRPGLGHRLPQRDRGLGPDAARVVGEFEKVHRVPFGEYVPYRSFFAHFASLSGVPLDAVPGHGSGLMRTPGGAARALGVLRGVLRGAEPFSVRAGAELLAVPTNTSSYSTAQVPAQEVAADVVQAIETGRDLVQAAPTGFSTVVTQRGVVVERSTLGERQVLTATVSLRRGLTPYDHWGDLPVLIFSADGLVGGWVRQLRLRRAPRRDVMTS